MIRKRLTTSSWWQWLDCRWWQGKCDPAVGGCVVCTHALGFLVCIHPVSLAGLACPRRHASQTLHPGTVTNSYLGVWLLRHQPRLDVSPKSHTQLPPGSVNHSDSQVLCPSWKMVSLHREHSLHLLHRLMDYHWLSPVNIDLQNNSGCVYADRCILSSEPMSD